MRVSTDPDDLIDIICLRPLMLLRGWSPCFHAPGMRARLPRWQANRHAAQQAVWLWPPAFPSFLPKAFPMHILTRLTPPASEPISLAEAKLFLRIDENDEDTLVQALIASARTAIEEATGRSLLPQHWSLTTDAIQAEAQILLPRGPVRAIDAVEGLDAQGNATALDAEDYVLLDGGALLLKTAPLADAFRVRFAAGYDDATMIPAPLVQAVRMLCAYLYEDRDAAIGLPASVAAMIAPYRPVRV